MNKRGLKCNERAKAIRVSEVKQQEQRKKFKNYFCWSGSTVPGRLNKINKYFTWRNLPNGEQNKICIHLHLADFGR